MKKIILLMILIMSFSIHAATWEKTNLGTVAVTPQNKNCPVGYVGVPALLPYTVRYFCVMKYEAKNDGYGTAVSTAAPLPWASIDRATARSKCQSLGSGYDMISNEQWQTIARNIASVAVNWSSGVVTTGQLNSGHSDTVPNIALPAVADDNDPCYGTGQICSATTWDSQRRTHVLSNGGIVWDLGGNVHEWVTNNNTASNGADAYMSQMRSGDIRQTRYGAAAFCATPDVTPYCGMGIGYMNYGPGAVVRGGVWSPAAISGVFTTSFSVGPTFTGASVGFRCVFVP